MRIVGAIFLKELKSYFISPVAYVILTGFIALTGWFFYNSLIRFPDMINIAREQGQLGLLPQNSINYFIISPLFGNLIAVFMILVPMITMRLFCEEKRNRTEELLLTSPISINQIVAGKYLSCLAFLLIMLALTVAFPAILFKYGEPDIGTTAAGYVGLTLLLMCYAAIGIFTSSLTENQIVSAVTCFIILLAFFTVGLASGTVQSYSFANFLKFLSLKEHAQVFINGGLYTKNIIYYLTFTLFWLFMTSRSLESARWR